MKPIRTQIEGFGPHENLVINWGDLPPISALVAPNGTGKTFALEADFAALYGAFPSYGEGSLYDNITPGRTSGRLCCGFEDGGHHYVAERVLKLSGGGTQTQKATLTRDGKIVAGPKIRDFESKIEVLFGSWQQALASWFASQNSAGDLTLATPGEAAEIFGEFLGFAEIARLEKQLADERSREDGQATELEAQAHSTRDFTAERAEIGEALAILDGTAPELRRHMDLATERVAAVRRAIDGAAEADAACSQARDALDRATARREALTAEIARIERQRDAAVVQACALDAARRDVARAETLALEIAAREQQETDARVWANWERERLALRGGVDKIDAELRGISATAPDAETVALAGRIDELREEYKSAEAHNRVTRQRHENHLRTIEALKAEIAALENTLARQQKRIATNPKPPGEASPEVCAVCPLMSALHEDAREMEITIGRLAELRQDAIEYEGARAELPEIVDINPLIEAGQRARSAADAVGKHRAALARQESLHAQRCEIVARLDAHGAREPEHVESCTDILGELRAESAGLSGAAERVLACHAAADRAHELAEAWHAKQAALAEAQAEASNLSAELSRVEEMCATPDNRARLKAGLDQACASARECLRAIEELAAGRAQLIERQRGIDAEEARLGALCVRALVSRARVDRLATLRGCFSKRGVRQILLDSELPQLETIANRMLRDATGGRQVLRVLTQRENKDTTIREGIYIMVRDAAGERNVSRFSGGEKRMLRTVLRLALGTWAARLGGHRPDQVRIDEGFDALDDQNKEQMIALLKSLESSYSRVVVITHDDDIAARLPGQLRLSRIGGATCATIVGAVDESSTHHTGD